MSSILETFLDEPGLFLVGGGGVALSQIHEPIRGTHSVIRDWVVRFDLRLLLVVFARFSEILQTLIDAGQTRDGARVLGILFEDAFERLDRAMSAYFWLSPSAERAGIELLGVGSRQIEFGVGQLRDPADAPCWKYSDRLFVLASP